MNSIKQVTSGLASSLFLAAGLTRLAEKTDPMHKQHGPTIVAATSTRTCSLCIVPCYFTPQTGH